MHLTKAQQALFWRTLATACQHLNLHSSTDRDHYRRQVITEETSHTSLKEVNRTSDFDRVMLRLASDAADYELAIRFSSGDERRMAHHVEVCAAQLVQLHADHPDPHAYIIGIITQAGYHGHFEGSVWWLDLTTTELYALFQMLDTHRRRLLKRLPRFRGPYKFNLDFYYTHPARGTTDIAEHTYASDDLTIRVA